MAHKEVEVEFQPIVDLSTRKLVAAEGLVRWEREDDPAVLIEQFDYHQLTHQSFNYILHEICRRIQQSKYSIVFSMNLSVHELLLSDFLEDVEEACEKYKVAAKFLQFEIVEDKPLLLKKQIKSVLSTLRGRGHAVGMDDFGDGYFSFTDFIDLPIDFIKLDKQFVQMVESNLDKIKSIEHVIAFAQSLGLQVIIEGIETE